ncbi:diguanylate cyclase/phosphodiesterase domain 1 (GGDEF) [Thioalkalivibrio nitratireducens DSM 14787]|uniref:diguanylate cyclase n=1 Tax=Thioalkalivibrio nitratireducens (strain DSM 14787 / UNIQEM 213 / ALEN2) TaxID=1255043 RepID=L0DSW4_THIND|nr:GGDEF domain-containing protein [Thioalkalivibrio nitratireducens]AGA32704.1 diguanylate cyclase/phosphodiesterase domain 1 (GGDEF) [Thioalkalivibrio nitratireducens DSM 14787]
MTIGRLVGAITPRAQVMRFLNDSISTLLALFEADGTLVEANRGFRHLLESMPDGRDPAVVFVNPGLAELNGMADEAGTGLVYRGLMTVGNVDCDSDTWLGTVYRVGYQLLVACERDIAADRNLRVELFRLTDEYAAKERMLAKAHRELARRTAEVERLTFTDSLTDLPNRRAFDQELEREILRSARYGEPLSLLIVDLDHFKRVNDRFGHAVGDDVLRSVAASLRAEARGVDTVARWGGEEFAVLVPATGMDSARRLAERIRRRIGKMSRPEGVAPITASVGVAGWLGPDDGSAALFKRADRALYKAKHDGRNRIRVADEGPECQAGS